MHLLSTKWMQSTVLSDTILAPEDSNNTNTLKELLYNRMCAIKKAVESLRRRQVNCIWRSQMRAAKYSDISNLDIYTGI